MKLSISETAKLMGISVRTLHYYDEIDLLKPAEISEAGYRFYSDKEISKLHQIIFYRELEFTLNEIKNILSTPDYDAKQALENRLNLLILKRQHIDGLIELCKKTIGGKTMSKLKITTENINETKKIYAAEIREKWGNTIQFEESEKKYDSLTNSQKENIAVEQDKIFSAFAECTAKPAGCKEVQSLVETWKNFITDNYYQCTNEILKELGQMYTADERFSQNLDKYGTGTAKLISKAIEIFTK